MLQDIRPTSILSAPKADIFSVEDSTYELLKIQHFFTPLGLEVYLGEVLKKEPYGFSTFCVEQTEEIIESGISIKGMRTLENAQDENDYLLLYMHPLEETALSVEQLRAWSEKMNSHKQKYARVYLVYTSLGEVESDALEFAKNNAIQIFSREDILLLLQAYTLLDFFDEISGSEVYRTDMLFTPYFFEQIAMQLQFDYQKESVKQDAQERRATLNKLLKIFQN